MSLHEFLDNFVQTVCLNEFVARLFQGNPQDGVGSEKNADLVEELATKDFPCDGQPAALVIAGIGSWLLESGTTATVGRRSPDARRFPKGFAIWWFVLPRRIPPGAMTGFKAPWPTWVRR